MIWNTFDRDRKILDGMYANAVYDRESGREYPVLKEEAKELLKTLDGVPHPVAKAKIVEHILDNIQLGLYPEDWFGILWDAQRVTHRIDAGCDFDKIAKVAQFHWQDELYAGELACYNDLRCRQAREAKLIVIYPDYDHSTPCWHDILTLGLKGLLDRVLAYQAKSDPSDPVKQAFFEGIVLTYRAILRFMNRLAAYVEAHESAGPKMPLLAKALRSIAAGAPQNTYEALLLSLIYWKIQENIEAQRARTLGGVDTLYRDFYRRDIQNGTFDAAQIKELFKFFMNHFSAMNVRYQQPMYFNSQDEEGNDQITDFSWLIFNAYDEADIYDPKLQVRISPKTPDSFLRRVLEAIRGGNSSISIINDEVAFRTLRKCGATEEEARTFLMSGCWDYTVKEREAKTIPFRLNMGKLLELAFNRGVDPETGYKLGCDTGDPAEFKTFADFRKAFEKQFDDILFYCMNIIEHFERKLDVINPANMYSATMREALEKGEDAYATGAKYCNTALCIGCLATAVDSLTAVRKFVFDRKLVSMKEFAAALAADWKGYETLRKLILDDSDKYGNGSELADGIMLDLQKFIASRINGRPNARGGIYKNGQITIDFNVVWCKVTGATPDGRKSGEPLFKNLCPNIGMNRRGILEEMRSICKMDMTDFSHAGMYDFVMHPTAVEGDEGLDTLATLVRTYFKMGGHSIQGNIFDADVLRDAQAHPEKYRTLQVRVCGWNVYFVNLSRTEQDLFIAQTEHRAKVS